jgi:hypothetical protein
MNGVWLAGSMKLQPRMISRITIVTLVMTMIELTNADSFMPRISSSVSAKMMPIAGRLTMPCARTCPSTTSFSNGEWHHSYGIVWLPGKNSSSLLRYSLHAMPTVAAPIAYSSTRSQPMIHATSSPSVAYEYVYALPAIGIIDANSA